MATPKDNQAAWLKLVAHLEGELVKAKSMSRATLAAVDPERYVVPEVRQRVERVMARQEATVWAAQRLLDALSGLTVPPVPRDDTEGQEAIPFPTEEEIAVNLGLDQADYLEKASSTPGENPGDDPRSRFYRDTPGAGY